MCYQEGMVMENLMTIDLVSQWDQVPLMFAQAGLEMDLHWYIHLVHKMEMI